MAGASDHAWRDLNAAERMILSPRERNALHRVDGPGATRSPHIKAQVVGELPAPTKADRRLRNGGQRP